MSNFPKHVILLAITLLLLATVAACSPAGSAPASKPATPGASQPAAATPSTTVTNTPEAPTAVKRTPESVDTSFTSTTYVNDEYGFFLKHPKKWVKFDQPAPTIYAASTAETIPEMRIVILDTDNWEAQVAKLRADEKLTNIKVVAQKDYTFSDGTAGKYEVFTCDYPGAPSPLISYGVMIIKGPHAFSFFIITLQGMENDELFNEIFKTITYTK
jgi:hypothetical protein